MLITLIVLSLLAVLSSGQLQAPAAALNLRVVEGTVIISFMSNLNITHNTTLYLSRFEFIEKFQQFTSQCSSDV